MAPKKKTPAYLAYTTFRNTVRRLGEGGSLPSHVDRSALGNMNGSVKGMFLAALSFFDLIDEEGKPSSFMKTLAVAEDDDGKAMMRSLIEEHYASQLDILRQGTPQRLRESFGDMAASLPVPAARFLVAAARDVGIEVSKHITSVGAGGGAPKRTRKKRTAASDPPQTPPPAFEQAEDFERALLKKFPDFQPDWDEKRQEAWFSAYAKLMDMHKARTASEGGDDDG